MLELEWHYPNDPNEYIALNMPEPDMAAGIDEISCVIRGQKNYLLTLQSTRYEGAIERLSYNISENCIILIVNASVFLFFENQNPIAIRLKIYPAISMRVINNVCIIWNFYSIIIIFDKRHIFCEHFQDEFVECSVDEHGAVRFHFENRDGRVYVTDAGHIDELRQRASSIIDPLEMAQ